MISRVDVARKLQKEGIHTTLIPDSGVGYFMHKVNLVRWFIDIVMIRSLWVLKWLWKLEVYSTDWDPCRWVSWRRHSMFLFILLQVVIRMEINC